MAAASSWMGPQPQPWRTRGWRAGEWSRRRGCASRAHWPRADCRPAGGGWRWRGWAATDQGTAATAIEVAGLVHVYPDGTRALDGVDLRVVAGESVAIIGQNGSGKTTLARHLNGLLRPTEGIVRIQGRDIAGARVARLAAVVGLALQDPDQQIFAGRVRAEVAFGPRNLGMRGLDLDGAVADALAAVGLADAVDAIPYDLGYARRKLLAIASVLAMRTPIIILDEPTTGQDLRGATIVREIVRRLTARGADRPRDQPRHALRGRDVRACRRHARGPDRPGR